MAKYFYEPGTVRWHRFTGEDDVRAYRPSHEGWSVSAELCENHPITGQPLPTSQWWIRERLWYVP